MDLDAVSARGHRNVYEGMRTLGGLRLLASFDFTPSCDVASYVPGTTDYAANTRTFTVTDFDASILSFPTGATNMALTLGVLHFDFELNVYELTQSIPNYITTSFTDHTFSLQAPAPSLPSKAVPLLGVKFYQEVGGQFVVMRGKKAVGLEIISIGG